MSFASFAGQTNLAPRFRRAMLIFWLPLVILAIIPVIVTLCAQLTLDSAGLLLGIPACAAIGVYAAHSSNKTAGRRQWQLQGGFAPIALFAILFGKHSVFDYAVVAFWIGSMLPDILSISWRPKKDKQAKK
jgi:hypothetical protein